MTKNERWVADMHENYELYHYGVLGMKWGVRRARRKAAKSAYRKATDEAFKKYEKGIAGVEKNYKRGQKLSDNDLKREQKIENDYKNAASKAKADYKNALKSKKNDSAIANKLYSKQSKEVNKLVTDMSTGKAIGQSLLMGSYGALKYNEAKARGQSTGKAAVEGVLYNAGNVQLGGVLSAVKYLDNRFARKK